MAITLRENKESELTWEEVDTNFSSLIHSGSITGNVLTLHYSSSIYSPTDLSIPIVSASYAVTSSIVTAISGVLGYLPVFTGTKSQGASIVFQKSTTNIGINTTDPDQSAILDLDSNTKGFLPPRMRTSERTSISDPATGLMVFDTDDGKLYIFTGSAWKALALE
jgi:hypothetical protein